MKQNSYLKDSWERFAAELCNFWSISWNGNPDYYPPNLQEANRIVNTRDKTTLEGQTISDDVKRTEWSRMEEKLIFTSNLVIIPELWYRIAHKNAASLESTIISFWIVLHIIDVERENLELRLLIGSLSIYWDWCFDWLISFISTN